MLSPLLSLVLGCGLSAGNAATPADTLPTPPAGQAWKLVWQDEFDGTKIDETKWERPDMQRRDGWWTPAAASLDGEGHLVMKTYKEGDKYFDACMRTKGKYEHTFGYYVARIKFHREQGHWPAFWLMGDGVHRVGDDGRDGTEIDIVEKPWLDGRICHAVHWDGYGEAHKSEAHKPTVEGVMDGWHTFSLMWTPEEYVFYVDGKESWRTKAGGICRAPLYIKLTDEIGDWAGDIKKAKLPDQFMVDYVRVYDLVPGSAAPAQAGAQRDVPKLIFDTDMGNDIDDALALGVIHALQSRGECELVAVTLSKDDAVAAPFVDAVNTFYGRGAIPVGVVRDGKTPKPGNYTTAIVEARDNGKPRYPHDLASGKDAPEAVSLQRRVLAAQPDGSVAFVVVGFSTNISRLLDSKPDEHSPLNGRDLVARKCRLLSLMGGGFGTSQQHKEYNIVNDLPAAQNVFAHWPTPIAVSAFEIGLSILYPAVSIERDFGYVAHHPLSEAYCAYDKMPYDRPTWDLTSVLYAVRPDRGYFGTSAPGKITIDAEGYSRYTPAPDGRHLYLTADAEQRARVREALCVLASQPPDQR